MTKVAAIITAALAASASAFAPATVGSRSVSSLNADKGYWVRFMTHFTLLQIYLTLPMVKLTGKHTRTLPICSGPHGILYFV